MGCLEHIGTSTRFAPAARALVGRAPTAALVLGDARVSGEHAALYWTGSTWMVRDLASRNGTWLDGVRLVPGEPSEVRRGAVLTFGGPKQKWKLVDASAPGAVAVAGDGTLRFARGGLLALPDEEGEVFVVETAGGWSVEEGDRARPAVDGETLLAGGRAWRLGLPRFGALPPTAEIDPAAPTPDRLALHLGVSADEEYVEATVRVAGRSQTLPPRVYHDLLLVLARERLVDRATCSPAEEGWLYFDDLCRRLGRDRRRVNVDVFRARQQLAELGVENAADLFERRAPTRQIRLGIADVTVEDL